VVLLASKRLPELSSAVNGLSLSPGQRFVLALQDGRKLNVIAQIANSVVATGDFILGAPHPRRSKPAS
jgi:hypothetical protein